MKQQKYDFFINYSRKDIDKARRIADVLRKLGFSYFFDIDNVVRGVDYNTVFKSAIENCNTMIFVSSKNSNTSSWVMAELNYAVNSCKRILPVIIDGTSYSEKIKMLIGDNASINVQNSIESSSFEKSFTKVLKIFLEDSNNQIDMLSGINKERPIFISYSRKDLDLVKKITSEIELFTGLECWRDLEDIPADDEDYLDRIVEGIENCKVFIFMLSELSQNSEHAIGELVAARKQKKKTGIHVVILNIDNCEMNLKFTVRFSSRNAILWSDEPQKENFLRCLTKWLSLGDSKREEIKENKRSVEGEKTKHKTGENSMTGVELHIDVDADCDLFSFKTFILHLIAGEDNVIQMDPGKYKFEFVSSEYPELKSTIVHNLENGISCDFIEIAIKDKIDAMLAQRKDAEEKAKLKAGENAIIKTEDMKHKIVLPMPRNDNNEKKYDVFICYRRMGGSDYARVIKHKLEEKYRVFMDYNVLPYGEFEQRIAEIINNSSVFLIILSKDALNRCSHESDWVRKEIQYAMRFGCHIVPIVVDDTFDTLPTSLPDELRRVIGNLMWSEVRFGSLFEASMNKLDERIEPYICRKGDNFSNEGKFNTKSIYHIKSELELTNDNRVVIKRDGNDNAKIIEFNESATYLWNKIKEIPFDLELLAGLITKEYDVDIETARKDCINLLESWYRSGLVYKL